MTGISALIKIGEALLLTLQKDCNVKTQEMPAVSEPERGFSPDTKSSNALDFPGFRTVR